MHYFSELPKECANDQVCDTAIKYSICNRNADADGNCECSSDRIFKDPANPSCSEKGLFSIREYFWEIKSH
jgi:hypothetical protein